jgi:phosphoribosylformylglycinamidine cyclo-ligase
MVKGMAHITGGGITGNLPRIFPAACAARLQLGSWPVPPIFAVLERLGAVQRDEMFRTFNMGIGFILVVGPRHADTILSALKRRRERAFVIGEVVRGRRAAVNRVTLV